MMGRGTNSGEARDQRFAAPSVKPENLIQGSLIMPLSVIICHKMY